MHPALPYVMEASEQEMSTSQIILTTFLSLSPMIGKVKAQPDISAMSLIQPPCCSTVFADKPINLTPRFVKSGWYFARAASSVVQTGV